MKPLFSSALAPRLGRLRRHAVAVPLAAMALAGAALPSAARASTPAVGWLHADGTALRQSDGQQVLLAGAESVNSVTPDVVAKLQAAGFNTVRYTVPWARIQSAPPTVSGGQIVDGNWNESYLSSMDNQIQRLTDAHIRVIIDFHQSQWSSAVDPVGIGLPPWLYPGAQETGADNDEARTRFFLDLNWPGFSAGGLGPQELAAAAIKMLAQRYAGNSYVVGIDLLNEPGWPDHSVAGLRVPTGADLHDYYQKAANAMRSANPNLLAIWETGTYAQSAFRGGTMINSPGDALTVPNAVLSWHFYPANVSAPARDLALLQDQVDLARQVNEPFWMGEFDAYEQMKDDPSKHPFGAAWRPLTQSLMQWAHDNAIGWNVWAFQQGAGPSLLDDAGNLKTDIVSVLRTGMRDPWGASGGGGGGDTTPPTVPGTPSASAVTRTSLTLDWGASTDASGGVSYRITQNGTLLATSTSTSLDVTGLSCDTSYTFGVSAVDASGNASGQATTSVHTDACQQGLPSDTTAPTVGGLAATVSGTSATITAQLHDDTGVTQARLVLDGAVLATRTISPALASASVRFSVPGPLSAGSHTAVVYADDAAGNEGSATTTLAVTSGSGSRSLDAPVGLASAQIAQKGFKLTWRAVSAGSARVTYTLTRDGSTVGSTRGTSFYFGHLDCGTTYMVGVSASAKGASTSAVATLQVATAQCPDTTAPSVVFTSTQLTGTGPSVRLSVTTTLSDDRGVQWVQVELDGRTVAGGRVDLSPSVTYSFTLGRYQLKPGSHTLVVTAHDARGNAGEASYHLVVPADTTGPSTPSGLSATNVTHTSFTLHWNPSTDENGVAKYLISIAGHTYTMGARSTSRFLGGLRAGGRYTVQVRAVDKVGNPSAPGTLTVTLPAKGR